MPREGRAGSVGVPHGGCLWRTHPLPWALKAFIGSERLTLGHHRFPRSAFPRSGVALTPRAERVSSRLQEPPVCVLNR